MEDSQLWRKYLWPEWTIDSHLGSGSCGDVYKIRRTDIGGTYFAALKVMSIPSREETETLPTVHDQEQLTACYRGFAQEISREFAVMERLKGHTNIVSYEDHKIVPREDGVGWYVLIRMELLKPMMAHLHEIGCTEAEAIRLGCDICDALALCQRENIIHRDIKPANIFISHYGSYKLGDFGIAMRGSPVWSHHSARGTYPYMAPEVFRGMEYDATIDLYALGLILYRLMNHGRPPFLPLPPEPLFTAAVEEAHRRRIAGQPLPPPARASRPLAAVILKACAPDPRDRYRTAGEMKRELQHCTRETPAPESRFCPSPAPQPDPKKEELEKMKLLFSAAGDL